MKYKIIIAVLGIFTVAAIMGIMLLNTEVEVEQINPLEKIEVEYVDVSIQNVDFSDVEFDVSIGMHNPNDVTSILDRTEYQLWLNGNYLGEGKIEQDTDIPPFTSKQIHTEFTLSHSDVWGTILFGLMNYLSGESKRVHTMTLSWES